MMHKPDITNGKDFLEKHKIRVHNTDNTAVDVFPIQAHISPLVYVIDLLLVCQFL